MVLVYIEAHWGYVVSPEGTCSAITMRERKEMEAEHAERLRVAASELLKTLDFMGLSKHYHPEMQRDITGLRVLVNNRV